MPSFYALMGVEPFDPDHGFVTSWLLPSIGLAILRTLFALCCWTNLFACFGYDGIHSPRTIGAQFSYFTDLTWWGITFYMTIAAVHTWVYNQKGYTWLDRWPRFLQLLHSLFYTTIVTYPFLVTIVYWGVLYRGPWYTVQFDAYRNVSRHALNSLAAFLEIVLPATKPPPWLHIPFIVLILAFYLALAYVTRVTQGFYPYDFLDPANGKGRLAGYIVGIAVASVIIFLVVWGLIWLRKRFTKSGKKSKKDKTSSLPLVRRNNVEMVMK